MTKLDLHNLIAEASQEYQEKHGESANPSIVQKLRELQQEILRTPIAEPQST